MKQEGSKCEAGECGGMVRERGEVRTKRERDEDKTGESREWADNEMGRR